MVFQLCSMEPWGSTKALGVMVEWAGWWYTTIARPGCYEPGSVLAHKTGEGRGSVAEEVI